MVWDTFWVSIRAALLATAAVAILGFAVGYWLARSRLPGKSVVEAIFSTPMALPPTVVGYYITVVIGERGPIGSWWERLTGHELMFTFTGVVIAQAVEAFPYGMRAARAAVEDVDTRYEQLAATMGFSRVRTVGVVTLPLASAGLVAGIGLAFGRALGDYGATLLVSSGAHSTTMPLEIVNQLFSGNKEAAQQLAVVQVVLAVVIMVGVSRVGRSRGI